MPADHLARLRDSDALLHVVRAFEDPATPHPAGSVDPARDLEQLDLEFTLADLSMTERRLERLKGSGQHGTRRNAKRPGAKRSCCAGSTKVSKPARRSATWGSMPTMRKRSAASDS